MATWVFSRPSGSFTGQADTDLATVSAPLQDTPGDFGTATAVAIASTAGAVYATGWDNDSYGVECRIMSGATVLAAGDAGGTWVPIQGLSNSWATAKPFPAINFAYVNSAASPAVWDAATIQYRQLYSKTQKADNGYIIVAGGTDDITVTYVGAPATADANITLGALTSVATGTVPVVADIAITFGAITSIAQGKVRSSADSAITLGALTASSSGTVANPPAATADADITFGALTLAAQVLADREASASITLGALGLIGVATVGGGTAIHKIYDEDIAAAFGGGGGGTDNEADFVAAENLSPGDICYLDSAGEMALADASAEATASSMLAVCKQNTTVGTTGTFVLQGFRSGEPGLTTGAVLYLSTTAGGVTHTPPSGSGEIVRVIGYATAATQYYFSPDKTWLRVA